MLDVALAVDLLQPSLLIDSHLINHLKRILLSGFWGSVRGVSLLPKELRGSQEGAGTELPTKDVGPLVDLERQITVGGDPVTEGVPNYSLRGGADDEGLLELGLGVGNQVSGVSGGAGKSVVSNDSTLQFR